MPTRAEVRLLQLGQKRVAEMARSELAGWWATLDKSDLDRLRSEVETFFPILIEEYGRVAEVAAADWYEDIYKERSRLSAKGLSNEQMARARAKWAIGESWNGKHAQSLALLELVTDEMVRQFGRDAVQESAKANKRMYARVPVGETCSWCLMLASRGFAYHSETDAGKMAKFHAACVVPGTRVSGPEANVAMMREFEGEVVTLATAGGHELTITPNHPVLTRGGWKPAGLLREGDDLVCGPRVDRGVVSRPDEDHVPSRIEDVMRAMSVMLPSGGLGMPGAAEQFHGDGTPDSEVNVVDVRDLLRHEVHATLGDPASELQLEGTTPLVASNGLSVDRLGAGELLAPTDGSTADGGMGGRGLSEPLGVTHLGGAELSGGRSIAGREPGLTYPPIDDGSLNSRGLEERVDALTLAVPTENIGIGGDAAARFVPRSVKFDPAVAYASADGVRAYAERGGDLLARLAGFVEFDRLVDKSVGHYSGHVYNLSTVEGWYNANSITVSNCDCEIVPDNGVIPDGYDADVLYEQYQSVHQPGDTDKDVARKLRAKYDIK